SSRACGRLAHDTLYRFWIGPDLMNIEVRQASRGDRSAQVWNLVGSHDFPWQTAISPPSEWQEVPPSPIAAQRHVGIVHAHVGRTIVEIEWTPSDVGRS